MKNEHLTHPNTLNYNNISDGIFVGSNQCCSAGLSSLLKKEGITADISLEEDRLDQPFGVDMYLWLPVIDREPPSPNQLELGVSALEKMVSMNKKIYVHCKNGHGRSTTLVAAYFIKTKGFRPKEAEEFIKKQRPTIHLQTSQQEALQGFYDRHNQ